jgi:hypothetical protein
MISDLIFLNPAQNDSKIVPKRSQKNKKLGNIDSLAFLVVRKSFQDYFTFNKVSVYG